MRDRYVVPMPIFVWVSICTIVRIHTVLLSIAVKACTLFTIRMTPQLLVSSSTKHTSFQSKIDLTAYLNPSCDYRTIAQMDDT